MHARKESCTYIMCLHGLKSLTIKAYIELYALCKGAIECVCGLTLFSGALSSRRRASELVLTSFSSVANCQTMMRASR